MEIGKEKSAIKSLEDIILDFDKSSEDPEASEEIKMMQFNIDFIKREIEQYRSKIPSSAGLKHFEEKESLNIKIKLIEEENRSYNQQLLDALELIKDQILYEASNSVQEDNDLVEKGKILILTLQEELAGARSELQRLQSELASIKDRQSQEREKANNNPCSKCILL